MSCNNTLFNYNAIAVDFMVRGRYCEANDVLKAALLRLRDMQGAAPSILGSVNNGALGKSRVAPIGESIANWDSEVIDTPPRSRRGIHSVRLLSHADASRTSPTNLFLLYAAAFTVDQEQANGISNAQWTAILLYNMAIARHLYALIHRPKDDRALRHVSGIYQAVMKAVYCIWEDHSRIWLTMAVACNEGHIHCHRLDFRSTRERLSLLLRFVMQPLSRSVVPQADLRLFFDTVSIFMEGMDLALAPAA